MFVSLTTASLLLAFFAVLMANANGDRIADQQVQITQLQESLTRTNIELIKLREAD